MFWKGWAIVIGAICMLMVVFVIAVRSWSATPHGRLDWRVAILMKYAE